MQGQEGTRERRGAERESAGGVCMAPLQQRQALGAMHLSTINHLELAKHAGECSGFSVPECWWEIATKKLIFVEPTKIRQMTPKWAPS